MWSSLDEPAIVYRATSKTSGKFYIGVTGQTLEQRKYQHVYHAQVGKKKYAFAQAIRKYGADGLEWAVLSEHATMREAIAEEKRLIRELCPKYNENMGGHRIGRRVFTAEHRAFLSKLHKGNKYRLGQTASPATRARLREVGIKNRAQWLQRSHLGPAAIAKRVVCLSDGKTYVSASAAARAYKVHKGVVIEVCNRDPRRCSAGGHIFRYERDIDANPEVELAAVQARLLARSRTGVRGIIPYVVNGCDTGRFRVRFKRNSENIDLGIFNNLAAAKNAYLAWENSNV